LTLVLYAKQLGNLPRNYSLNLLQNTKDFLLWQAFLFVPLLLLSSAIELRPDAGDKRTGLGCRWLSASPEGAVTLTGRFTALYLVLSTLALLALSNDVLVSARFLLFLAWTVFAINSTRLVLRRHFGSLTATWGLATGVMYGVLIPLSLALGIMHLMKPAVIVALAVLMACPGALDMLKGRKGLARTLRWIDTINPIGAIAAAAIWIGLALSLIESLAPELASDSMRRHLPYVQNVARHSGFESQYLDLMRLMPKAIQAFAAAAYVVGSYPAAKWISWFSLVGLALLVGEEVARRSGLRNLGIWAAAATLACPLLLFLSRTLFVDHVIAFLCVAAFVALFRGFESGSRKDLIVAAFILGGALQTKYTVFIFGIVWGVALLIYATRRYGTFPGIRWSAPVILCVGLTGIPWYLYTYAITGNPLYPWLDDWFKSPYWLAGASTRFDLGTFTFGESITDRILFPWVMTFKASDLYGGGPDGLLGFQFLGLLPFLLIPLLRRQGREIALFMAAMASFAGVCFYTAYARYWLPVYPLMLIPLFVAIGTVIKSSRVRLPGYGIIVVPFIFMALILHFPFVATSYSWQVYRGSMSERDFLLRTFSGYPAIEALNAELRVGDKTIVNGYGPVYTIDGDAYEILSWRTKIYRLNRFSDLQRFLWTNDVRYWVVDYSFLSETVHFEELFDAGVNLWLNSRLVSADSTVAVYDVARTPRAEGYFILDGHDIEPSLRAVDASTLPVEAGFWSDGQPADSGRTSLVTREGVMISPVGDIFHQFALAPNTMLCKATLELPSQATSGGEARLITRYEWLGEDFKPVADLTGRIRVPSKGGIVRFFGSPPTAAKYARIRLLLRSPGGSTLTLRNARLDLLATRGPEFEDRSSTEQ
jgi:hypothetical protein